MVARITIGECRHAEQIVAICRRHIMACLFTAELYQSCIKDTMKGNHGLRFGFMIAAARATPTKQQHQITGTENLLNG